jgi:HK97 gp10 family phage protein
MSVSARAQYTPRSSSGQFVAVSITPAVIEATESSLDLLAEKAKEYVAVDTGELRDSIHAEPVDTSGQTVTGRVTAGTDHDGYVEFGTGIRGAESDGAGAGPYDPAWPGMVAQPYMRPALDEARDAVIENFNSGISLALTK